MGRERERKKRRKGYREQTRRTANVDRVHWCPSLGRERKQRRYHGTGERGQEKSKTAVLYGERESWRLVGQGRIAVEESTEALCDVASSWSGPPEVKAKTKGMRSIRIKQAVFSSKRL